MGLGKHLTKKEQDKQEIIQWVKDLDDDSAIERLKMLRDHASEKDWWDEVSDAEKAAIEAGLEDVRAGKVTSHQEVRRLYEKWL
jgi:pyruvate-formate lyase-activating enzyme